MWHFSLRMGSDGIVVACGKGLQGEFGPSGTLDANKSHGGAPGGDGQKLKCPETILVEGNNADWDGSNHSCGPDASTADGSNCSSAPPPSSKHGPPPSSLSGSANGLTESDSEPSYEPSYEPSVMPKKAPPQRNNRGKAQNSQKATKSERPKKAAKSERPKNAAKNAQAKKAPKPKPDKKK